LATNPEVLATLIEEFRIVKLESILRDVQKLNQDDLEKIKFEIDKILLRLNSGDQNAHTKL